MSVIFTPEDHSYQSVDPAENISWLSVTTLVSHFKQPFNAKEQAKKSAKNKNSKWFGMTPSDIEALWSRESERATTLGTFYHNQREEDLTQCTTINRWGVEIPVIKPQVREDGKKEAPVQRLEDGVYPEHFVYSRMTGICGQSDLVEVIKGVVYITDYKTNKEIKMESFKNWQGTKQKMLSPLSHLDDCNFNHYALQLSIYMHIILRHNPHLKPGTLILHHVTFEEAGRDQHDYPIIACDHDGNPIVKDVKPIEVPYMRREVTDIMNYLETNRELIKKK